ncbi:MAG: carbohydrate-binding domain-containing protein, partial [Muribaculaceae bacterium]|nr:carbohydrate-binding domain-containing protein [Muribaculaceae bacterium]
IYAKEYITLKNASVYVVSAVKDGLNCNQYFAMESGLLDISGTGDDGMQVSFKDDADREAEDTGSIIISGGTLRATSSAAATKAVKADGFFTITGGELTASTSGTGMWDSAAAKTKAAACVSADGGISVEGGQTTLSATGAGGKGFNTDAEFRMDGGQVDITTTGGIYAYVNGREYENYTGNTDNLDSDAKSSPKGIKADGGVVFDGGVINVTTTGHGGEGIESKSELTINDGVLNIRSYDDAINSAGNMYINGGVVTVIATGNDGLDSNKNLYINGGVVRAFGAGSPECGIDANDEAGYSVIFTGGMLLAAGGSNSTPSGSESVQPYLSLSNSLKAGDTVTVKSGDSVLASFEVPEGYNASGSSMGGRPGGFGGSMGGGLLISCPGLVSGSSYTVTYGTTTATATAQLKGSSSGRPR